MYVRTSARPTGLWLPLQIDTYIPKSTKCTLHDIGEGENARVEWRAFLFVDQECDIKDVVV